MSKKGFVHFQFCKKSTGGVWVLPFAESPFSQQIREPLSKGKPFDELEASLRVAQIHAYVTAYRMLIERCRIDPTTVECLQGAVDDLRDCLLSVFRESGELNLPHKVVSSFPSFCFWENSIGEGVYSIVQSDSSILITMPFPFFGLAVNVSSSRETLAPEEKIRICGLNALDCDVRDRLQGVLCFDVAYAKMLRYSQQWAFLSSHEDRIIPRYVQLCVLPGFFCDPRFVARNGMVDSELDGDFLWVNSLGFCSLNRCGGVRLKDEMGSTNNAIIEVFRKDQEFFVGVGLSRRLRVGMGLKYHYAYLFGLRVRSDGKVELWPSRDPNSVAKERVEIVAQKVNETMAAVIEFLESEEDGGFLRNLAMSLKETQTT
jgi:hypothetical protein